MDSFYDAPRRPPQPLIREALNATPVVPDISVLCASNVQRNAFTPYNNWKTQQHTSQKPFMSTAKENFSNHLPNASILKKQVRFVGSAVPGLSGLKTDENIVKEIINEHKEVEHSKPSFEQMYMANIPSRKLDLSVIDLPNKKQPKASTIEENAKSETRINDICNKIKKDAEPKTYKAFLEAQKDEYKVTLNDSVTDIFNYKRGNHIQECPSPRHQTHMKTDAFSSNVSLTAEERNSPKLDQYLKDDSKNPKDSSPTMQFLNSAKQKEDIPRNKNIPDQFSRFDNDFYKNLQSTVQTRKYIQEEYIPKPVTSYSSSDQQINCHNHIEPTIPIRVKKCDNCETKQSNTRSNDDVSVKDLLKIISQQSQQIAQQNEQLLLLQKQMATLICRDNDRNSIIPKSIEYNRPEQEHTNNNNDRRYIVDQSESTGQNYDQAHCHARRVQQGYITSTQHENYNGVRQNFGVTPKKDINKVPNFSIGVMTSFEVSIRNPNKNTNNNLTPKIQEITEGDTLQNERKFVERDNGFDNNKTLPDVSMTFREPIRVREQCPSPEPSIKISMNAFEDSDCEDQESSDGATFYNNLMAQVNKILQKAQIQTRDELAYDFKGQNETVGYRLKNETMHKVKEATLKHLRNIGVEVPTIDDSSSCSSDELTGKSYDQEDISFTVKQLLMKYLPDDHLAKIGNKGLRCDNPATLTPKEKIGAIKNRPEFSFATVQYMKKYNLISNVHNASSPEASNKILDLTKLKQQPKLL